MKTMKETLSKALLKIQSKYRTLLNMINEEEKNVKSVIRIANVIEEKKIFLFIGFVIISFFINWYC